MLHLHKPTREELRFRQELLSDPSTMSYNHAYGGTIVFPPARWEGWAAHWLDAADGARFYRYLAADQIGTIVESDQLAGPRGRHIRGRDSLSL